MTRRAVIAAAAALALCGALLGARALLVDRPLERLRRDGSVYEGSWYFPRGGPFILGFESPRAVATLRIDGAEILRGSGVQTARVIYDAGAHALRFEAPAGARLLWHPPGRRGQNELEYVPPSSLSPDPPAQAVFGRAAGASPADGVIAALMLLVLLATAITLARPRPERRLALWTAAAFALALAVRLYGLGDAGQTWDEDVNWSAGRNYVTNWLALDFSPASWRWNYEHPPVGKLLAGLGAQFADGYGPARAVSAILLALACALLVPIGARLYSLRAGVLGAALAGLTPHLIAHGQVVGHEAPSALFWTAAVFLALRAHDGGPAALPRRLVGLGLVLGLAVFTRFANVLLAPLLGALLLLGAPPGQRRRTCALGLAILPAVALALGFAIWPRLWTHPIAHLQEAWARLSKTHDPEPFLGAVTATPPFYYFAVYLVATAPLGLLAASLAGAARAAVRRERAGLVLAAWLCAPLLIMFSPVRQDGVRYILPALLPLALVAAAGLEWIAARRPRLLPALGGALALYLAVTDLRVRPYYLDYYGEQVGGPAGAARRRWFEVGWWGEGIAPAIDFLDREAAPGARVDRRGVIPGHVTWMRADLFRNEVGQGPATSADWIVRNQIALRPAAPPAGFSLAFEERVLGAPLTRVYRRGSPPAAPPR